MAQILIGAQAPLPWVPAELRAPIAKFAWVLEPRSSGVLGAYALYPVNVLIAITIHDSAPS